MLLPVFRKIPFVAALTLAAVAAPVSAQGMFSDSYNFLEAVRDRDGDKVTSIVNTPGSTLINTRDRATGDTALHIVTRRSDSVWVKFLSQKGANPNVANKDGETPIMIASALGDIDSVEALLKAGARVDDANNLGETPLISAVHRRDVEMVRLLLGKGADPDRSDNSGRTARDYIAMIDSKRLTAEFTAHDSKGEEAEPKNYGPVF